MLPGVPISLTGAQGRPPALYSATQSARAPPALYTGMRIFRFLADFRFLHGQFGHSRNLYRSAIKNVRGGRDVWSFIAWPPLLLH